MVTQPEVILDNLPDAILIFDKNKKIDYMNGALENLFDVSRDRFLGKEIHCQGFPFQEQRDMLAAALDRYMDDPGTESDSASKDTKKSTNSEHLDPLSPRYIRLRRDPPNTLTIKDSSLTYKFFSIDSAPGGYERIGLVLQDLTKERIFHNDLLLEEKIAGLKVLSAGIAHEINNPLQMIMSFTESILFEKNPERIQEHAISVLERTKRLAALIRDFSTGLQVYPRYASNVDVVEQTEKALHIAFLSCHADYVKVEKDFPVRPCIKGQPDEIQQIFFTIFCNAIEAMGGKGRLQITSGCYEKRVYVRVEDDGPGIPQEFMSRVFDPFFSTKGEGKGAGLGLHIARGLVEKNQGQVDVYSEEGKGSTFEVSFPL